ncbi:MAG: type II toxin-antitoxin system PemK/MazF family toxin [Patescibacteria group bacterium]
MKRFLDWIGLKEQLHGAQHRPPLVSQREIWWASIGENVGSEINGKSSRFSRPVIIFKKLSHGFYFVIPTTTQEKTGTWYSGFTYQGKYMLACLHQARAIDYRRLTSRLGQIDSDDFESIKKSFVALYL